ncbi:IS256 family transposase, variant Zn-binding type [Actinobacillus pleuropneumoniae]|uniref:IS256 family transposase, variant Zn-binding type n=1 Tax=Actinobacillus pleuropneumoniae TaxID=715 RepID=UPI003D012058
MFCSSFNLKKYGKINGVQRYKCLDCHRNFVASKRLNLQEIWFKYTSLKQTIRQLAIEYQCSERTIRRHLQKSIKAEQQPLSETINIVMDTTHFKQRFAVLVLVDSLSAKPVYFRFIPAEKNQYYFEAISELMEKGIKIQSITCDGRRGLLNAYPDIPTQMCHFHQVGRGIFYLTKSPKSPAGKALLELYYSLKSYTKKTLNQALLQWLNEYKTYFNERSEHNAKRFKHKRLRSAYWSLKRSINYLFTYQDYPELHIAHTTNLVESFFKLMKAKLAPHQGLTDEHKMVFIKDFICQRS